ncbi:hypothetical protein CspeluHIS016_0601000 [Cutaneotrichosporon spelunceum]|uniref:Uncharacterized protein n=1 Tax=Cutaneotrichosporon spelunceum TaxID=1672016 RepID=A0AAD3YE06_9TREE|nr:hypothetical protein CspeluHIS016_0601000 [Cutaneotrichosporon spelunceum]
MLSRDKRPQPPVQRPTSASVHPAFLPVRVHATSAAPQAQTPLPAPLPPAWTDASKVSPAWEGWGRGPAAAAKSRM